MRQPIPAGQHLATAFCRAVDKRLAAKPWSIHRSSLRAVQARVVTTHSADWRIGDGPWTPVDGPVTIAGDPVALTVLTATPQLVG